ncbi:MAG: exodeoxyribonuclease III [Hydrogenophilales bacterium CG03_land_8_20_14_0_80_62_28]|nr:exodeoxyribonuclease III [Betaproteobacteria bacterium]PIV22428.1 MAG: exodeoxyribonuclease III [Hydrogenophilales bacterium CG03_land_8_20_14_0_80_62_28]PIX01145.1 MAG: exodeoxyribonuclease III [Hydrogenophilales bacterium CG_4_8_14_3_um_filter_62_83]PIY98197.1 MAG: exodeoxyribonuclease III [Hydrogenophilales bacterium CG_4_10_14_0_8_um_filter_62_70]
MKLATWNVNSLKVRLPHLLDWLAAESPDVVCLQETKLTNDNFPVDELKQAGYRAAFSGQKTYNGVAILSRVEPTDMLMAIPAFPDEQKRVLAATVDGTRIICLYIPNGQSVDSDKYQYKLAWLDALQAWLKAELAVYPRLAVLGDFNIAPEDRDVHDPAAWAGHVLCSEPERAHFHDLLGLGLKDAFRLFEQDDKRFSWWDYRQAGFRRNRGLRIDHILLSAPLAAACKGCRIDTAPRAWERPSDHAPVSAEIAA